MSLFESERTWRLIKLREATQSNMHDSTSISAFDTRELTTLIYVRSHVRNSKPQPRMINTLKSRNKNGTET